MISQARTAPAPRYGVNPFTNASAGMTQAFRHAGFGLDTNQQVGNAMLADPNPTAATIAAPGTIASGMSQYMNPFIEEVVNRNANDITRSRDIALSKVAGDAAAAKAFGGARHGLVEGAVYDDANRAIGDMSAALRAAGFNTAGQFAGQDISNQIGVNAANAAAENDMAKFGAELDLNTLNSIVSNALSGSANLAGLAGSSFGMGSEVNRMQSQQGAIAQGLNQQILDLVKSGQLEYLSSPEKLLSLRLASVGQNPLVNAGTTTSKTTGEAGMAQILGMLLQAGSSMVKFNPITLGGP